MPAGPEQQAVRTEAWTWDLVRLLFEALPGGSGGGSGDDEAGAAAMRRAALSHWLQVCNSLLLC